MIFQQWAEAALDPTVICFQAFVSSQCKGGEERMHRVDVVFDIDACFTEAVTSIDRVCRGEIGSIPRWLPS